MNPKNILMNGLLGMVGLLVMTAPVQAVRLEAAGGAHNSKFDKIEAVDCSNKYLLQSSGGTGSNCGGGGGSGKVIVDSESQDPSTGAMAIYAHLSNPDPYSGDSGEAPPSMNLTQLPAEFASPGLVASRVQDLAAARIDVEEFFTAVYPPALALIHPSGPGSGGGCKNHSASVVAVPCRLDDADFEAAVNFDATAVFFNDLAPFKALIDGR